jgi:hypothetical protein
LITNGVTACQCWPNDSPTCSAAKQGTAGFKTVAGCPPP